MPEQDIWNSIPEVVNRLQDRIRELEIQLGEAQQWIDSEPDWKDKYMKNYMALQDRCKKLEEGIEKHKNTNEWDSVYGNRDEELYKLIEKK